MRTWFIQWYVRTLLDCSNVIELNRLLRQHRVSKLKNRKKLKNIKPIEIIESKSLNHSVWSIYDFSSFSFNILQPILESKTWVGDAARNHVHGGTENRNGLVHDDSVITVHSLIDWIKSKIVSSNCNMRIEVRVDVLFRLVELWTNF